MTEGNAIVVTRDPRPGEQGHLQAFRSGGEARHAGRGEAGAKDHLHLTDAADAEHAEDAVQRDLGLGFLPCLARAPSSSVSPCSR